MEKAEEAYARLLAMSRGKIAMCIAGIGLVIWVSIVSRILYTFLELSVLLKVCRRVSSDTHSSLPQFYALHIIHQ